MADLIMMSVKYRKRPSEIFGLDNEYFAYCFDEIAMYLEANMQDKQGNLDWRRIKWIDTDPKKNLGIPTRDTTGNKDFMKYIEAQNR